GKEGDRVGRLSRAVRTAQESRPTRGALWPREHSPGGFSMQKGNLSRRGFMQRSLTALTAAGLPAWYAKEVFGIQAAQEVKQAGQSDAIIMGAIGFGSPQSRGLQIYNEANRTKKARYVAACDVDKRHLDRGLGILKNNGSTDPKGHKDYRELLDNK